MSIDGKWNLTMNSPLGVEKTVLDVASDGTALTGTITGPRGTQNLADGKVEGNKASWKLSVTSPFPVTVQFDGTVDGDSISGTAKPGAFPAFQFSGTRA